MSRKKITQYIVVYSYSIIGRIIDANAILHIVKSIKNQKGKPSKTRFALFEKTISQQFQGSDIYGVIAVIKGQIIIKRQSQMALPFLAICRGPPSGQETSVFIALRLFLVNFHNLYIPFRI